MGWLQDHMTQFVVPVLGFQPSPLASTPYFTQEELTVLKNLWRSCKAKAAGRPILLPGRDVFVFEILARREGFPTTFRPEISRLTVEYIKEDYSQHFIFDTGYAGTIPRALRCQSFSLASGINQAFPHLKGSRSLVLKIERTPKYWKRGFVLDGVIKQDLSSVPEFIAAATITEQVYKNSAPKFNGGVPLSNIDLHIKAHDWLLD